MRQMFSNAGRPHVISRFSYRIVGATIIILAISSLIFSPDDSGVIPGYVPLFMSPISIFLTFISVWILIDGIARGHSAEWTHQEWQAIFFQINLYGLAFILLMFVGIRLLTFKLPGTRVGIILAFSTISTIHPISLPFYDSSYYPNGTGSILFFLSSALAFLASNLLFYSRKTQ